MKRSTLYLENPLGVHGLIIAITIRNGSRVNSSDNPLHQHNQRLNKYILIHPNYINLLYLPQTLP